ncbi:MAG: hypothetical protein M1828_000456 [Chrysothrix sp. TS-e1954]|nr:MAG: hypothetical protein M1828_000456 [Chrysothrix sp. TS-e1954]
MRVKRMQQFALQWERQFDVGGFVPTNTIDRPLVGRPISTSHPRAGLYGAHVHGQQDSDHVSVRRAVSHENSDGSPAKKRRLEESPRTSLTPTRLVRNVANSQPGFGSSRSPLTGQVAEDPDIVYSLKESERNGDPIMARRAQSIEHNTSDHTADSPCIVEMDKVPESRAKVDAIKGNLRRNPSEMNGSSPDPLSLESPAAGIDIYYRNSESSRTSQVDLRTPHGKGKYTSSSDSRQDGRAAFGSRIVEPARVENHQHPTGQSVYRASTSNMSPNNQVEASSLAVPPRRRDWSIVRHRISDRRPLSLQKTSKNIVEPNEAIMPTHGDSTTHESQDVLSTQDNIATGLLTEEHEQEAAASSSRSLEDNPLLQDTASIPKTIYTHAAEHNSFNAVHKSRRTNRFDAKSKRALHQSFRLFGYQNSQQRHSSSLQGTLNMERKVLSFRTQLNVPIPELLHDKIQMVYGCDDKQELFFKTRKDERESVAWVHLTLDSQSEYALLLDKLSSCISGVKVQTKSKDQMQKILQLAKDSTNESRKLKTNQTAKQSDAKVIRTPGSPRKDRGKKTNDLKTSKIPLPDILDESQAIQTDNQQERASSESRNIRAVTLMARHQSKPLRTGKQTQATSDEVLTPTRIRSPPTYKHSELHGLGPPWNRPLVYPRTGRNKATVDFEDLQRLDDDEFLNDNLISFCLRYAQERSPNMTGKVHMFNSFFYETLTKSFAGKKGINYEQVKKWTSKTPLFDGNCNYVVIPINANFHWYVVIACNLRAMPHDEDSSEVKEINATHEGSAAFAKHDEAPTASHPTAHSTPPREQDEAMLDQSGPNEASIQAETMPEEVVDLENVPLKQDDNSKDTEPRTKSTKSKKSSEEPLILILDSLQSHVPAVFRNIRDYLVAEAQDKHSMALKLPKKPTPPRQPRIPQQNNYSDCGVYLVAYIAKFLEDPEAFVDAMVDKRSEPLDWRDLEPSKVRSRIRNVLHSEYERCEKGRRQETSAKVEISAGTVQEMLDQQTDSSMTAYQVFTGTDQANEVSDTFISESVKAHGPGKPVKSDRQAQEDDSSATVSDFRIPFEFAAPKVSQPAFDSTAQTQVGEKVPHTPRDTSEQEFQSSPQITSIVSKARLPRLEKETKMTKARRDSQQSFKRDQSPQKSPYFATDQSRSPSRHITYGHKRKRPPKVLPEKLESLASSGDVMLSSPAGDVYNESVLPWHSSERSPQRHHHASLPSPNFDTSPISSDKMDIDPIEDPDEDRQKRPSTSGRRP